jgi:hypothetical protein
LGSVFLVIFFKQNKYKFGTEKHLSSSSSKLSTGAQPKEGIRAKRNFPLSAPDDDEGSDDASDSSEERSAEILRELDQQSSNQVKASSSPEQNEYLASLMKPSERQQTMVTTKLTLHKDPLSLTHSATKKRVSRTGDVTGHCGSMSV